MRLSITFRRIFAIASLVVVCTTAGDVCATIVRIQTTLGNIDVRLYDAATPLHVANMLSYINSDRYDGTFIHRSAKHQNGSDFVIQGGGYKINSTLFSSNGWSHIPTFSSPTNEPGISNLRGTLALAKGSGISSGTSEWFINMNNVNTFLDQPPPTSNSFTVFGRVIQNGMTVADAIADLTRVNASGAGSAFGELPILDIDKVLAQQDVLNEDVVRVTDVFVRNLPAGDYNFDGTVNNSDYAVWRASYGSTTAAEADGNGNGIVDAADYTIWRNTFGQTSTGAGAVTGAIPEPGTGFLLLTAAVLNLLRRRRAA